MSLPLVVFDCQWFTHLTFVSPLVSITYNVYKWLIFLLYGSSELERILTKNTPGFARTIRIERSSQLSDNVMIRDGLYSLPLPKYVTLVFHEEWVSNSELTADFKQSVIQIRGYRTLIAKADALKNSRFTIDNESHVVLLRDIWDAIVSDEPFSLKSRKWSDIGFQGTCPATDFRGMGELGAENLRYFVKYHKKLALEIYCSSLHPQRWYPFATVSINLTGLLWRLLRDGTLKTHFYNSLKGAPRLVHLHLVYVCLFAKFNEFWSQQPRDVMLFNAYLDIFEEAMRKQMRDENFKLPLPYDKQDMAW